MRRHSLSVPCIGVLAALALHAPGAAASTDLCVHNVLELGLAYYTANHRDPDDPVVNIRVVAGSYAVPDNHFNNHDDHDLQLNLSGGWNSDCTVLASFDPAATKLDGGDGYFTFDTNAAISFIGLHFDNYTATEISGDSIKLRRNLFSGPDGTDPVLIRSSQGLVRMDNNLFKQRNLSLQSYDGTDSIPIDWEVVNNTFVGAVAGSSDSFPRKGYGLYLHTPGDGGNISVTLANNVAWGNSAGGVYFNGQMSVLATHNQWQSLVSGDSTPLATGSGANSTANPQLDANQRLTVPGSPAINTGTTTVPGGVGWLDAGGGMRIVGSTPDRGAFESATNDAATITVTSAGDGMGNCPGSCTLRTALTQVAASTNAQRIEFDLPGACPVTIAVGSALPQVNDILTIDGYTQPGSKANTLDTGSDARLCVILRGNYSNASGLVANDANAIMEVKGLAFENFDAVALRADAGNWHAFYGNQFGGSLAVGASGSQALQPNGRAIRIGNAAGRVYIGGPDDAQRNVIDGSTLYAVGLLGSVGRNYVRNNYIGLAPNGTTPAANAVGVIVQSPDNEIVDNAISANTGDGLRIEGASGNAVHGNLIGVPAKFGPQNVGNGGAGVRLLRNGSAVDPTNNVIGASSSGVIDANTIADNGINGYAGPGTGDGGVALEAGSGNHLTGNRMFANYGSNIDLGADGPTANDATDADTGPNARQNFPLLLGIRHVGGARKLDYSLYTANSFTLEVFGAATCDANNRGNAGTVLSAGVQPYPLFGGAHTVTTSRDVPRGPGTGVDQYCRLSATATAAGSNNGGTPGDTSELSTCFIDDTIWAQGFDNDIGWACAP